MKNQKKEQALVIESTGSKYELCNHLGERLQARLIGRFRIQGIESTNPVAVGDQVLYILDTHNKAIIVDILPRKNHIVRRSVNLSKRQHILASNIDQAFLLVTLKQPVTSSGFIDRFLVAAQAYKIQVILVFNKIDLFDDDLHQQKKQIENIYITAGYTCLELSVKHKQGLDILIDQMKNKTSLLAGHSGVGKSSLINALNPELSLKVGSVSDYHQKGQHTTTFAKMHAWPFGGYIVDTPGIKGFGLIDISSEELSRYFPDFLNHIPDCQFRDCRHLNEPNCKVIEALKHGEISIERYKSYLSLLDEIDQAPKKNYRKTALNKKK